MIQALAPTTFLTSLSIPLSLAHSTPATLVSCYPLNAANSSHHRAFTLVFSLENPSWEHGLSPHYLLAFAQMSLSQLGFPRTPYVKYTPTHTLPVLLILLCFALQYLSSSVISIFIHLLIAYFSPLPFLMEFLCLHILLRRKTFYLIHYQHFGIGLDMTQLSRLPLVFLFKIKYNLKKKK